MQNFHITRIAVIPLLIVALAIQPVAVCLANVGGGSGCSRTTGTVTTGTVMCQGCGCCEVERAADRCCCCSAESKSYAKEEVETSCCSSKHDPAQRSGSSSEQQSVSSIAPIDAGVRSICLCEQQPQPLSDSSPRRSTGENRDLVSFELSHIGESRWSADRLIATGPAESATAAPSHFAQVMLCIWRL